jgi:hypothetical protein
MRVTREEERLIWVLRDGSELQGEVLRAIPGVSHEELFVVHRIVLLRPLTSVIKKVRQALRQAARRNGRG